MEEKTLEDYRIEREQTVCTALRNGTLSELVRSSGYSWDKDFLIDILSELAYVVTETPYSSEIGDTTADNLIEYKNFGLTDQEIDELYS